MRGLTLLAAVLRRLTLWPVPPPDIHAEQRQENERRLSVALRELDVLLPRRPLRRRNEQSR